MGGFDINDINEPNLPSGNDSTSDSQGNKESKIWDKYDEALFEQHQTFTLHLNKILFILACIAIILLFVFMLILSSVWVYHLITPCDRHYLTTKEIQGIERILFSSILLSVFGKYFGKFKIFDNRHRPKD